MTTVAHTAPTVQFDAALRTLAQAARTRYAGEAARIDRALVIALNGGVTLHADGSADVQSCRDAEVVYYVGHGACDCPDFARAPGGRCKHRFAVCLVKKARAEAQHAELETIDRLLGLCDTVKDDIARARQLLAQTYYTTTTEAQGTVCGGHRATADAKRAEEEAAGGLARIICGYGR